jgi:hypothetical protein
MEQCFGQSNRCVLIATAVALCLGCSSTQSVTPTTDAGTTESDGAPRIDVDASLADAEPGPLPLDAGTNTEAGSADAATFGDDGGDAGGDLVEPAPGQALVLKFDGQLQQVTKRTCTMTADGPLIHITGPSFLYVRLNQATYVSGGESFPSSSWENSPTVGKAAARYGKSGSEFVTASNVGTVSVTALSGGWLRVRSSSLPVRTNYGSPQLNHTIDFIVDCQPEYVSTATVDAATCQYQGPPGPCNAETLNGGPVNYTASLSCTAGLASSMRFGSKPTGTMTHDLIAPSGTGAPPSKASLYAYLNPMSPRYWTRANSGTITTTIDARGVVRAEYTNVALRNEQNVNDEVVTSGVQYCELAP